MLRINNMKIIRLNQHWSLKNPNSFWINWYSYRAGIFLWEGCLQPPYFLPMKLEINMLIFIFWEKKINIFKIKNDQKNLRRHLWTAFFTRCNVQKSLNDNLKNHIIPPLLYFLFLETDAKQKRLRVEISLCYGIFRKEESKSIHMHH